MQTIEQTKLETITLYYREGNSDKVYQCCIEPAGDLFVVNFAYGRRGATLNTGTKTSSPVDYDDAKRVYDKLVKEKTAKGYTEGETGTPYQHTDKQVSGILPQLLNPIDEAAVQSFIKDPAYCAQEKFDGRHLLIRKQGADIHGINKKGLLVGLPQTVLGDINNLPGDFIPDGESVADDYHAFDLLELNGENLRPLPYRERLVALMNLLASAQHRYVKYVETAFTTQQKSKLLERLRRQNREGIVFKRLDAAYTPGRPNSGGPQLKHKFYATCSAVVARINPQRSVEAKLLNCEGWQSVGNVTIPVNFAVPRVGEVVEIRYLYAYPESRCLYQPVYLGPRSDVESHECLLTQLKYKPQDES